MRDTSPAKFEPALRNCLIDSDPEAMRIERARRRRSMMLSSLIQAALLTAAIVVPLFASQVIPALRNEPRLPAPKGIRIVDARPQGDPGPAPPTNRPPKWDGLIQPPRIPDRIPAPDADSDPGEPSNALPPGQTGCPQCDPNGVLPPEIFDRTTPVTPAPKATAPDSRPRGPVRVSPPVQEAKLIHRIKPAYPPLALQIRREGRVELHAIIGTDGTMRELKVISGDALFIQSALDAVQQWRYQPTLLGSEPVEVQTRITVIFVLNR